MRYPPNRVGCPWRLDFCPTSAVKRVGHHRQEQGVRMVEPSQSGGSFYERGSRGYGNRAMVCRRTRSLLGDGYDTAVAGWPTIRASCSSESSRINLLFMCQ